MKGHVYIMTNDNNTVLYTGVTSDLKGWVTQHKVKKHPHSFSSRYNICKLVYFESLNSLGSAELREKQIKGWIRSKKINLIESMNPERVDLGEKHEMFNKNLFFELSK